MQLTELWPVITNNLTFDPPTRLPELTQNWIRSSHCLSTCKCKFHANRSSHFLVMLLTKKQRKKEIARLQYPAATYAPIGCGVIIISPQKLVYISWAAVLCCNAHHVWIWCPVSRESHEYLHKPYCQKLGCIFVADGMGLSSFVWKMHVLRNSVLIGCSRSSKVVDFDINWQRICNFLLGINSKLGTVSEIWRIIGWKLWNFPTLVI